MNILKVDTCLDINVDSSPSTSSTSSSPSPLLSQSDSIPPSLSRQSSQTDTIETASTTSLSTPTVKFAPLPTIGPRKRRSNQPLGMAARAQLVNKRRPKEGQNGQLLISASSLWSSAELEEQRRRIEVMAARHAEFQARENAQEVSRQSDEVDHDEYPEDPDLLEVGIEDPILVIGKFVKVAGKTIWNRMAGSKPEPTRPRVDHERRRDLSPLPILIRSVLPPEQVPPEDIGKEPTQQPETSSYEIDITEQNDQLEEDAWQPGTIIEPVNLSDEEFHLVVTSSAPPD